MSLFAEAARKAAKVRFKQPQLDAEGQEVEVGCMDHFRAIFACTTLLVSQARLSSRESLARETTTLLQHCVQPWSTFV